MAASACGAGARGDAPESLHPRDGCAQALPAGEACWLRELGLPRAVGQRRRGGTAALALCASA
eukprot:8548785-Pyramimonas_sp.AAC.1